MRSFKSPADLLPYVTDGVLRIEGSAHFRVMVDVPWSVEIHGDFILDKPARFGGSVEVEGTVLAQRGLYCGGNLRVRGGVIGHCGLDVAGSIEARKGLVASPAVRAGGDIITRGALRADDSIVAGGAIRARKEIFAGARIQAGGELQGRSVTCLEFDIRCTQLATKTLPFGRAFWAAMPFMAPWKKLIDDPKQCWPQLRELGTDEERRAVASAPLHWSLQAQLSNFLGLTTQIAAPEAQ